MQHYIHGFSSEEQARLVRQAAVLEREVFRGLDISDASTFLEVGCAVGAELQLAGRRWPHLHLTGLDISRSHLAAARHVLAEDIEAGRVVLVEGDAGAMPIPEASFDRVMTIWMLEHVPDPAAVIAECLRVLKPNGRLICTEVDNATFGFSPANPVIMDWWGRFNRFQQQAGGDPFIGPKLSAIAGRLNARDIKEEVLPIISSRSDPARRKELLDYLDELLASGADQLRDAGLAGAEDAQALHEAFQSVKSDQAVHFQYHATRLTCRPPAIP
jgi:ubiquinone/menaquinone biosynthesis C-methylase UbiE